MRLDIRGQELDRRAQARHGVHQRLLDRAAHRGGAAESPTRRNVHVHVDETALAGAARRDMVEAHRLVPKAGQHGFDVPDHLGLERLIHQAVGRAVHERIAFAHDVQRHADGDHRVEPLPAGQLDGDEADDDARRRPHIGDQVARVGFERHRALRARLAQHADRQARIEHRAEHRQRDAQRDGVERLRVGEPVNRGPDDAQRRGEDQHALEAAGEVFGLVVAIGVAIVGRSLRDGDHQQRKRRSGQVDERLHRVGQQADRICDPPSAEFQADRDQRDRDRKLQIGADGQGVQPRAIVTRANLRLPTCTT